jgi:hypothetical protein
LLSLQSHFQFKSVFLMVPNAYHKEKGGAQASPSSLS